MGTMTIDGRKVEFTDEKNVLTVIRNAGINIPTLCFHINRIKVTVILTGSAFDTYVVVDYMWMLDLS